VETWIDQTLPRPGIPSEEEISAGFVQPLLNQIRRDASRQIVHLAENRLGIHGPVTSVRQAARGLGLTRARIYQLLNEINDIMSVRWPHGRQRVYELHDKFQAELDGLDGGPDLAQFHAAVELFYPASRRAGAAVAASPDNAASETITAEEGEGSSDSGNNGR
jgi:hypothetical protein